MSRVLSCVLLVSLLWGCSQAEPDRSEDQYGGITVDGIIIQNGLAYPVTDVMIEVPATGGFAGCGNILPRTECRTSFPARGYSGNPVVVSWKEYGAPQQTDEFVVKLPEHLQPGDSAWLEVVVFMSGQAGARFVQP